MHLCARMIQRRNAEKHILARLPMMALLHHGGVGQAFMVVQDGFWKARGAGGKVDRRVVLLGYGDHGIGACGLRAQQRIALGKGGAGTAHIEQRAGLCQRRGQLLHAADKFRPEYQRVGLG